MPRDAHDLAAGRTHYQTAGMPTGEGLRRGPIALPVARRCPDADNADDNDKGEPDTRTKTRRTTTSSKNASKHDKRVSAPHAP